MDKYTLLTRQGEGSYATVYKARNKQDGRIVAIKHFKHEVNTFEQVKQLPEVRLMGGRSNPNIVQLLEVIRCQKQVFLIFEFCKANLYETMTCMVQQAKSFSEAQIRYIMQRLLRGLAYLHERDIIHRDIKPENLLLTDSEVKLADFGQARSTTEMYGNKPLTHYVATRWYRSPELLLHVPRYTTAVDIWAAGAVMAELFLQRPIFNGTNEANQIFKIFQTLGPPFDWSEVQTLCQNRGFLQASNLFEYSNMNNNLSVAQTSSHRNAQSSEVSKLMTSIPRASREAIDVLVGMLTINPAKRLTAKQLLQFPFFNAARIQLVRPMIPSVSAGEANVSMKAAAKASEYIMALVQNEKESRMNKVISSTNNRAASNISDTFHVGTGEKMLNNLNHTRSTSKNTNIQSRTSNNNTRANTSNNTSIPASTSKNNSNDDSNVSRSDLTNTLRQSNTKSRQAKSSTKIGSVSSSQPTLMSLQDELPSVSNYVFSGASLATDETFLNEFEKLGLGQFEPSSPAQQTQLQDTFISSSRSCTESTNTQETISSNITRTISRSSQQTNSTHISDSRQSFTGDLPKSRLSSKRLSLASTYACTDNETYNNDFTPYNLSDMKPTGTNHSTIARTHKQFQRSHQPPRTKSITNVCKSEKQITAVTPSPDISLEWTKDLDDKNASTSPDLTWLTKSSNSSKFLATDTSSDDEGYIPSFGRKVDV